MIHFIRFFFFILLFLLGGSTLLYSQRPGENPIGQNPIGRSNVIDSTDSGVLPLDTPVAMTYALIQDPATLHSFIDTFTWEDMDHHPLHFYQAHLGNFGSPSRSLIPLINRNPGFSTGWDQYDPYFIQPDSFRYYDQRVPVAKIKHSQAGQEKTYLTLDFGRSFARGLSLSIIYNRINQEGEFGLQPDQTGFQQKNTALGIGVWHNAPSGRYDAFYNILSNVAVGEENGGVSAPELIGDSLTPNLTVPVFINNGVSTQNHRTFLTKQILHLLADSLSLGIDLWLQAKYATGLFKYVDTDTAAGDYYGTRFLFDPRGIRQFTFQKESEFSFGIALPWKAARSTIQSSLRYRKINLEQEPIERIIQELFLDASADFQWIEAFKLNGKMSIGLGQAQGTFSFHAEGILNTGLIGKFKGNYSIVSREPYLVESRLFVNQQLIYQTDFRNPLSNELSVSWIWEKQNLNAGLKWVVYDNYIYFDSIPQPLQISQSFSLRQFYIEKRFDFKWIGFDGHVIWQPDSREELAMPDLIYKASVFGRVRIFKKKLTVMPGIDITHHSGFDGISYFPVIGRYHLSNANRIPDYFRVDAAIGVKINFLKAFVRMEDIAGLWESRVLHQADFYPHYPGYFRIGIATGFFN